MRQEGRIYVAKTAEIFGHVSGERVTQSKWRTECCSAVQSQLPVKCVSKAVKRKIKEVSRRR